MFSKFAKWVSDKLGHYNSFIVAIVFTLFWLLLGPIYNFSDAWQLFINTLTTIITFLMVFLIQNTHNRDTIALHLKLDEIIRAMKDTHNELLKIEELSDEEIQVVKKRYENLAYYVKEQIKNGQGDTGSPEIPDR